MTGLEKSNLRKTNIDQGWLFQKQPFSMFETLLGKNEFRTVNLPHDHMIESDVNAGAPAAGKMGYYNATEGCYVKYLDIPEEWKEDKIFLRFDGVMMNAAITVNGTLAAHHHYGYTPFSLDITPYIYWGEKNRITVSTNCSMQPSSRWYTGAGIFRSVELVHTPRIRLAEDGIYAYTQRVEYENGNPAEAYVKTEITVVNDTIADHLVKVAVTLILDETMEAVVTRTASIQVKAGKQASAIVPLTVKQPLLWDADNPNLYQVQATVTDLGVWGCALVPETGHPMIDSDSVLFGIRTISADSTYGLRINGKVTKIKGGCIHHDNGILGAVSLYDSEFRKIKLLKDSGFNLVRLSHNPPSAVLLEACDRLGMYVFDEAFDHWTMGKNSGDYNQFFEQDWKKDMNAFITRDRNHPSILFWSIGNEVTESAGLGNGYQIAMELAAYVRSLDASRLVSGAVCSFWCFMDDKTTLEKMSSMENEFPFNTGWEQNAAVSADDTYWEERSEPLVNCLDVVGYNYMENHYEISGEMYPERVILGTESFPMEIDHVWELVEKLPYVIGDCTWTAFDYIGEAGIGKSIFVDPDDPFMKKGPNYLTSHMSEYPWRLANDADFDINGVLTPQGVYRRIVWKSGETGLFAWNPEYFEKVEIVSRWGWPDVGKCWNWNGWEGKPIRVAVYSEGDTVELFQNGKCVGRSAAGKDNRYMAFFDITYIPGTLKAISYRDGLPISSDQLKTTGTPAAIRLRAEKNTYSAMYGTAVSASDGEVLLCADGHSLAYVFAEIVDEEGNVVPDAQNKLTAKVTGAGCLAGFGSASPITGENYTSGEFAAYHGMALAIVRAGYEEGTAVLSVCAEGLQSAEMRICIGLESGKTE